jgi:glycosyltransferase involved in cell wall biosynthesis
MKINNVSVCLIAKNNEKTIRKALDSVKNIFNEIIVIDTGSTDKTIQICKNYTDKVFSYNWKDDFSDARNYAYNYVKNDWLFWIDTDEEFVIFKENEISKILNSDRESLFINRFDILPNNEKGISLKCRFLRNLETNYFYGKIHETPLKINQLKTAILDENIAIIKHYYISEGKNERNIKILKKIINETDNNIDYIDYSIYLLKEIDNLDEKKNILLKILDKISLLKDEEIKENNNFLNFFNELIIFYIKTEQYDKAIKYCDISLKYFPNNITVISMKGEIYFKLRDFKTSLYYYNQILYLVSNNKLLKTSYIYESIKSYGTLYNIAICHKELNNLEKCLDYLNLSLEIKPDFEPSIILLNSIMELYNINNK